MHSAFRKAGSPLHALHYNMYARTTRDAGRVGGCLSCCCCYREKNIAYCYNHNNYFIIIIERTVAVLEKKALSIDTISV